MVDEVAISHTEARLNSHEAVCAYRYETINGKTLTLVYADGTVSSYTEL